MGKQHGFPSRVVGLSLVEFLERWTIPEPNTGCYLYLGGATKAGYGAIWRTGTVFAHRYVWELQNGLIPEGGWICHRCDNPICCNPSHLYLGTPTTNNRDTVSRQRKRNQKLNPRAVREIRKQHALLAEEYRQRRDQLQTDLAAEFGAKPKTIREVVAGRTWGHVDKGLGALS